MWVAFLIGISIDGLRILTTRSGNLKLFACIARQEPKDVRDAETCLE